MNVLRWSEAVLAALVLGTITGCGASVDKSAQAKTASKPVITIGTVQERPMVRTVEMVGTLRGWEEVTVGAKRMGRVLRVHHDMGDHVKPGDVLAELDPIDARLAMHQAESLFLAELVKLGITRVQAEAFYAKFGVDEKMFRGDDAERLIQQVPTIVQARVQFDKAQLDVNRMRMLMQRGVGSREEMEDLENARDAARAAYDSTVLTARTTIANAIANRVALEQAEQNLHDMTVRVPEPTNLPRERTGVVEYAVSKREVAEGQMVREGDPVAQLVIENPLRLWGNVPERFSAEVKLDQEVVLRVASYDRNFSGRVARINPSVDPVSRTFQVEVAVPNDEGLLRPGGFAKASIITQRDDRALVVPREAIERFAGVTKVFVVNDPTGNPSVQAVPVTMGLEQATAIEVQGELRPNATVAISNLGQLAEGVSVVIRKETPESETPKTETMTGEPGPIDPVTEGPGDAQSGAK